MERKDQGGEDKGAEVHRFKLGKGDKGEEMLTDPGEDDVGRSCQPDRLAVMKKFESDH